MRLILWMAFFIPVPALATSWGFYSLAQLVQRGDLIVVGTAKVAADGAMIEATEVLKGSASGTIRLSTTGLKMTEIITDGASGLFFLMEEKTPALKGKYRPFHPHSIQPREKIPRTRRILAALGDPAILDELMKEPESSENIHVVAARMENPKSMPYLRARLRSKDDEVTRAALDVLFEAKDRSSVAEVKRLLSHRDTSIVAQAIRYLGWSEDPSLIGPLCAILSKSKYPDDHTVADPAAEALAMFRAPSVLPCLEKAASRGVFRAIEALGQHGGTGSFTILLERAAKEADCSVDMALYWLVRRSNRDAERWMYSSTCSSVIAGEKAVKWKAWWKDNAKGFRVQGSLESAVESRGRIPAPGKRGWARPAWDAKRAGCAMPDPPGWGTAFTRFCRFDEKGGAWGPAKPQDRIGLGLYWSEERVGAETSSTLIFCGPILCDDLHIRPGDASTFPACVPHPSSGEARLVPLPETGCQGS